MKNIETTITEAIGSQYNKPEFYGKHFIPTTIGPIISDDPKSISKELKSKMILPQQPGRKVEDPNPHILDELLKLAHRKWFTKQDIINGWNDFKKDMVIYHGETPTKDLQDVVYDRFKMAMFDKIGKLDPKILDVYNEYIKLPPEQQNELLRREDVRIAVGTVAAKEKFDDEIKKNIRNLRKPVMKWAFGMGGAEPSNEPTEHKEKTPEHKALENLSTKLHEAYKNANYDFKVGLETITINLVKNYAALNSIAPGWIENIKEGKFTGNTTAISALKQNDLDVYQTIDSELKGIEQLIGTGWTFDRDQLKSAISLSSDLTTERIFIKEFAKSGVAGLGSEFLKLQDVIDPPGGDVKNLNIVKMERDSDTKEYLIKVLNSVRKVCLTSKRLTSPHAMLTNIATGLGVSATPAILKQALYADVGKNQVPNMIIDLGNKAKEIYENIVIPSVKSMGLNKDLMDIIIKYASPSRYANLSASTEYPLLSKTLLDKLSGAEMTPETSSTKEEPKGKDFDLEQLRTAEFREPRERALELKTAEQDEISNKLSSSLVSSIVNKLPQSINSQLDSHIISAVNSGAATISSILNGISATPQLAKDENKRPTVVNAAYDRLAGVVSDITGLDLDVSSAKKLISAVIAAGDQRAIDLIHAPSSVNYKRQAESLIKAAASTGDEKIIKWAVANLESISEKYGNTPQLNLTSINYTPRAVQTSSIEHEYNAFKSLGVDPLHAIGMAIVRSPEFMIKRDIKYAISENMKAIIYSYGKDIMQQSVSEASPNKLSDINNIIDKSMLSGVKIFNPRDDSPTSNTYKNIANELLAASFDDEGKFKRADQHSVYDTISKFVELPPKWIPGFKVQEPQQDTTKNSEELIQSTAINDQNEFPFELIIGDSGLSLVDRSNDAHKLIIKYNGIGKNVASEFSKHMLSHGANKVAFDGSGTPTESTDGTIHYYLTKQEASYLIGGLKPAYGKQGGNIINYGQIIGSVVNGLESSEDIDNIKRSIVMPSDSEFRIMVGHMSPNYGTREAEISKRNISKLTDENIRTELQSAKKSLLGLITNKTALEKSRLEADDKSKQKISNKISELTDHINAIKGRIDTLESQKLSQVSASADVIKDIIKRRPDKKDEIIKLQSQGWSTQDIIKYLSAKP